MSNAMDERDALVRAVHCYFEAMDAGDVDGAVACFQDDAVLIAEGQMVLQGKEEIRDFFERLIANSDRMEHCVTSIVVDGETRKVAAELRYANVRREYAPIEMANCNFFDLADDGRFVRVRFWVGDPGQLHRRREAD